MTKLGVVVNWLLGRPARTKTFKSYKNGNLYNKNLLLGERRPEGFCLIFLGKKGLPKNFRSYVYFILKHGFPCICLSEDWKKKLTTEEILALVDVFSLQDLRGYISEDFKCSEHRFLAKYKKIRTLFTVKTIGLNSEEPFFFVLPNIEMRRLVCLTYIEGIDTEKAVFPVYKDISITKVPLGALSLGPTTMPFSVDNIVEFANLFKKDSRNKVGKAFKRAQRALNEIVSVGLHESLF